MDTTTQENLDYLAEQITKRLGISGTAGISGMLPAAGDLPACGTGVPKIGCENLL